MWIEKIGRKKRNWLYFLIFILLLLLAIRTQYEKIENVQKICRSILTLPGNKTEKEIQGSLFFVPQTSQWYIKTRRRIGPIASENFLSQDDPLSHLFQTTSPLTIAIQPSYNSRDDTIYKEFKNTFDKNPYGSVFVKLLGTIECKSSPLNPSKKKFDIFVHALFFRIQIKISSFLYPTSLTLSHIRKLQWEKPSLSTLLPSKEQKNIFTTKKNEKDFPLYLGFQKALWTGSLQGLPQDLIRFYTEAGLLHILAVSGQHIILLSLIINFIVMTMMYPLLFLSEKCLYWLTLRNALYLHQFRNALLSFVWTIRTFLPLLSGLLLALTSQGEGSVVRALGMYGLIFFLSKRFLVVPLVQVCLLAFLVIILLDLERLHDTGFLLSFLSTCIVCSFVHLENGLKSLFSAVFFLCLLPIWMLPIQLYFFGSFSPTGFIYNLILVPLWDMFFIPIGFLFGLVGHAFPACVEKCIPLFEWILSYFIEAHAALKYYIPLCLTPLPKPGFLFALLFEGLLIFFTRALIFRIPFIKRA